MFYLGFPVMFYLGFPVMFYLGFPVMFYLGFPVMFYLGFPVMFYLGFPVMFYLGFPVMFYLGFPVMFYLGFPVMFYLGFPVMVSMWLIHCLYTSTGFVLIRRDLSSMTPRTRGFNNSRSKLWPRAFLNANGSSSNIYAMYIQVNLKIMNFLL